jgi:hypothetical protein
MTLEYAQLSKKNYALINAQHSANTLLAMTTSNFLSTQRKPLVTLIARAAGAGKCES